MARKHASTQEMRDKAIHLRLSERLGNLEISNITGITVSAVGHLLKKYPLTQDELHELAKKTSLKSNEKRWKTWNLEKEFRQEECIKLRVEKKMSLKEISNHTGVSKTTLSSWLKQYPLDEEELKNRKIVVARKVNDLLKLKSVSTAENIFPETINNENPHKLVPIERYGQTLYLKDICSDMKGKIAEAAILQRLVLIANSIVYSPVFDGERVDFLIQSSETGKPVKIQVKWARYASKSKLPILSVSRMIGCRSKSGISHKQKYCAEDFDFIIGYDFINDCAYVYSYEEIKGVSRCITLSSEYKEKWDKVINFLKDE